MSDTPCISLGPLVLPTIPDIFLAGPQFTAPVIGVDVTCCRFQIAIPGLELALAALNLAIAGVMTTLSAGVMVEVMTANEVIAQIQAQLNKLVLNIPRCPCDGGTIG